jgi:hypothetical protein
MRQMRAVPSPEMLKKEQESRWFLGDLDDSKEAVLAWNERRTPRYTGR